MASKRGQKHKRKHHHKKHLPTNDKNMLRVTGRIESGSQLETDIKNFFVSHGFTDAGASGEGDEVTLSFEEATVPEPVPPVDLDALVEEVNALNTRVAEDVKAVVAKIDAVLAAENSPSTSAQLEQLKAANEKFKAFLASL